MDNRLSIEEYVVEDFEKNDVLENIQIKYRTLLRKSVAKSKHINRYRCHHASSQIRRGNNIHRHRSSK